ncbi:hypothetical protein [Leptolyngbya sp. NIES-2104]|nr:hypothetical protein [Leptolyngbya sp. NIES-2104]
MQSEQSLIGQAIVFFEQCLIVLNPNDRQWSERFRLDFKVMISQHYG